MTVWEGLAWTLGAALLLAAVVALVVMPDDGSWWRHHSPRRAALERQRQIARRAGLDRYRPHTDDRFWDDWTRRHGGGL